MNIAISIPEVIWLTPVTGGPPPPAGDYQSWVFSFAENSGHLLTCGFI